MVHNLTETYSFYNYFVLTNQVPKGIVLPTISFCNKRYASLLSEIAIAKINKANGSEEFSLDMGENFISAVTSLNNLFLNFNHLRHHLHYLSTFGQLNNTNSSFNAHQKVLLEEWSSLGDTLTERWLISSLLYKYSEKSNWTIFSPIVLSSVQDTLVHCSQGHINCNVSSIKGFFGINTLRCHTYNLNEGSPMQESSVQGIKNGVTFVFMTGGKLIAAEYKVKGGLWQIPGYNNTFHHSAGSDGIRMMIHDPEMAPFPDLDAIDIAPGLATTIGITSKENTRLPHPYGDCAAENVENHLILKSVKEKLGFNPTEGFGILESVYNDATCRQTCLVRRIWERCGCFRLSEGIPFVNTSLFCGRIDTLSLFDAKKHGKEKCFDIPTMLDGECVDLLDPMFNDLQCIEKVSQMQEFEEKCQCPVPCYSREYEKIIGTSAWPSPGPELDEAYVNIVKSSVIPYLEKMNTSLLNDTIRYLSDYQNRAEIMGNFARVTVYVKSLKVDKIEQFASYTALDLISDIGELKYVHKFLMH